MMEYFKGLFFLFKQYRKQRKMEKDRPLGYEVDHIIPLSRGGVHRMFNLQYLKTYENRAKSNCIENPTVYISEKPYQYIPIMPRSRHRASRKYLIMNKNDVHKSYAFCSNFKQWPTSNCKVISKS